MDNAKEGCYLLWDVQRKEELWTLGSAATERRHRSYLSAATPAGMDGWLRSGARRKTAAKPSSTITRRELKQLAMETESWERISGVVGRVLRIAERG
jgi:hypothetical protein